MATRQQTSDSNLEAKERTQRRVLVKLSCLLASIIVGGVVCEIAARRLGEDMIPPQPFTSYLPRPWGSVMSPDIAPTGMVNSFGTFDVEHTLEKSPGTLRIATLGDSFLGLATLPHAEQTPQLLQATMNNDSLSRNTFGTFEVLNFSVSSAGTATEYLRYLHDARRFKPELVLVFFTVSNDVRNNSVVLQPMVEACPLPLPGFVLGADGGLKQVTMPPALGAYYYYDSAIGHLLVAHSAVYRKTSRAFQKLKGARAAVSSEEQWAITTSFLQQPYRSEVKDAWDLTEALFVALKKAVASDGANLAVVLVPTSWDIEPSWKEWLFQQIPVARTEAIDFDLPYNEAVLRLRRHDIRALDLRPQFRQALRDNPAQLLYDASGHWSVRGHATAAKATGEFVRELLIDRQRVVNVRNSE
jgi:hypothetical protein